MTITSQDVKLYKSEVMADVDDGGGRRTSNEVIDGELNNVFDDTSPLDRVRGRFSMRKIVGAIKTATVDKFLGAHAILTDPSDDPNVAVTLLDRNDHADHRSDAAAAVESYLAAASDTTVTVYGTQPAGARTLVLYQEPDSPVPAVGDVICLSIEKASDPNNGYQQFVRITSIATSAQTFYESGAAYSKIVATLGLGSVLEVNYPGADIARQPTMDARGTHIRTTTLSNTSKYYGVVPISTAVAANDTTVKVSTILQPIVPASYSETPLLDQQLGASTASLVQCGDTITESLSLTATSATLAFKLQRAALPGSLTVTLDSSNNNNDVTFVDQGGGVLQRSTGGSNTTTATASVVYSTGQVSCANVPSDGYTVTMTYKPACQITDVQNTAGILITLSNRGFNYSQILSPRPAPGAVVVTFRSLGVWYTLADNGAGQLVGAPGVGSGTVNYASGTVNVTCGYQPDVGSQVLFGWGTGVHYAISTGTSGIKIGAANGGIDTGLGIVPGSVQIQYTIDATTYTSTDDGLGNLTGDGTGTIDYSSGKYVFFPAQIGAAGTTLTFTAQRSVPVHEVLSPTESGGNENFTLSTAPIRAGSVRLHAAYDLAAMEFSDFSGQFQQLTGSPMPNYRGPIHLGALRGSIDLDTGVCALPSTLTAEFNDFNYSGFHWNDEKKDMVFQGATVDYIAAASTETAYNNSTNITSLVADFAGAVAASLVPNSLLFTINGRSYYDQAGGLFYRDSNGQEHSAGTVDYSTRRATITDWIAGSLVTSVQSLLTQYGQWPLSQVLWRTPSSPLRAESFQATDGVNTAIADNTGTLTGSAQITGSIDVDTGVYDVSFTTAVVPANARYNAVALTYLPLDPEILGIDPVRLPLDGRVPVFAPGMTLVVHNTQITALPNPAVAGQTYDLGRTALAYAIVRDQAGVLVPTDHYTTDLDSGQVTMANPLDLTGYTQPLQIEHRIEDMALCLDAQLSGDLSIAGVITHDFPLGSYVSSAHDIGDLQARTSIPFSQTAWTGAWSDSLIGSAPIAQYNNASYPIVVTNQGAIAERYRVEFLSSTTFRLIGETTGVHPTQGNVNDDYAPVDALTGETLMTIPWQGWGAGWVGGNQLRFNMFAASAPLWLVRCTLQGPASGTSDSVRIQFRGAHQ